MIIRQKTGHFLKKSMHYGVLNHRFWLIYIANYNFQSRFSPLFEKNAKAQFQSFFKHSRI